MAEKSLVNADAVTATVVAVVAELPAVVAVVLEDDELPHAASEIVAPMVMNTDTAFLGVTFMCLLLIDGHGEGVTSVQAYGNVR
jgi:hypothetical protein